MDVVVLGAMAVLLIAITLWLVVWPSRSAEAADGLVGVEEATTMPPQGDQFEDQYTSATADLSAGAVATTLSSSEPVVESETFAPAAPPEPTPYPVMSEPRSAPTIAHEASPLGPSPAARPRAVGLGAAALLTLGGAVGGAWLYARWQQQRKKPVNRLRRRFSGLR